VHPRISVSAISSFRNTLDQDLEFWARHGIDRVGVSVAKMEALGWEPAISLVENAVANGLRVANLIGLGPFHLAEPDRWEEQRARLLRAIDAARAFDVECLVFTTGPATPLTWEAAADALADALAPVLAVARAERVPFALEHTHALRVDVGFVHSLQDVLDLARRLDVGVCMEINACWAERGLAATIGDGVDRIRLVQVSDFRVGTHSTPDRLVPGDGDIPLPRILGDVVVAGYDGSFDLELIGPAIEAEGYDAAVPRAVARLTTLLDGLAV
jgi:sugar phosphate isomerase/epimerase